MLILDKNKDRSLKLRSNFLSKCKPLGTIIQFILFNKYSHFSPSYSFSSSVTVDFTKIYNLKVMCFVFTLFDDLDELGFTAVIP